MKVCCYCGIKLIDKQRKYCSDLHRFRYLSIVKDKPKRFSKSQHLRIARAGKAQRQGKISVRFN